MKLENENEYCGEIIKISSLTDLRENKELGMKNLDNLKGANIYGYYVLVQKTTKIGDELIFFPAETQLSETYCYENNLYSNSERNKDVEVKGYIGKNRRVRAIKLRGHNSNGMLMPIDSLKYLLKGEGLKVGDKFQTIDGVEVCRKYEVEKRASINGSNKLRGQTKKYKRIDGKDFPEHFQTEQYFRNEDKIYDEDDIIVTQKLHGTSVRLGNVECKIKQTWIDKLLKRQRTKYDYIAGSRRVIKDLKSEQKFEHFYKEEGMDIFNRALESSTVPAHEMPPVDPESREMSKLKYAIPKDTILYGEIIGWVGPETAIQKGYTYQCAPGEFKFYVYRIVSINSDGQTVDYSWGQVREFCARTNIEHVPELWRGKKKDFTTSDYIDKNYTHDSLSMPKFRDEAIFLGHNIADEGVCIRREGITPYVTKMKSPKFFEHETKLLDEGIEISS